MTEKQGLKIASRIIPGLVISLIAVVVLFIFSDTEVVLETIQGLNWKILLPAVFLVVISLFTRAFAWRGILRERITLWNSYLVINAGYFVNTVLPFRLGEISRAFLLKPSGINFWEALPSIVLERILDVGFALALLFIGLPSALGFTDSLIYPYALAGGVALVAFLLVLIAKNQAQVLKWLEVLPIKNEKAKARVGRFMRSIISSLDVLTDPGRLLGVLVGMTLSWGIALIFQYLLLRAFVPDARLVWAAFALGAVALGVAVPSSPGNIGIYEASITVALTACGIESSLAFSYALTSHVINLGVTTGFGVFGLVREGVRLREVWDFGKEHKEGDEI